MSAVVDTDILIDVLRRQEKAKNFIAGITENDSVAYVSVLTEAELLSGTECKDAEKLERAEGLLATFHAIDVTQSLARKAAALRRQHNVPLDDAIIAATALEFDIVLYTRNVSDFKKIKDLKVTVPY